MKKLLLIFPLLLTTCVFAQDTTSLEKPGAVSHVRETINVVSTGTEFNVPTDTLKTPTLDSLAIIKKLDSLEAAAEKNKTRLASVRDSLNRLVNLPQEKINQVVSKVETKIDTVVQRISRPFDEANREIDEAEGEVQSKLDGVEDKIRGKVDQLENKTRAGVSKATDGELGLPDGNLSPDGQEISLGGELPGVPTDELPGIPGLEYASPAVGLPGTENLKVPDLDLDVKDLTKKADIDVPEMDRVNELKGELQKIDGMLTEAEAYEEEIRNISENGIGAAEKIPEELESRVAQHEAFGELNGGTQKIEEYRNIVQGYRDPKLIRQELQRKLKHVANDKLEVLMPELTKAQQQFAKAKQLNPAVQSVKNLKKKRPNQLRGWPFHERFLPGTTLQVHHTTMFSLDWAMQAGYRVSGRLTAGVGYTYRVSFARSNPNWIGGEGIYGYRAYVDFGLVKNIYVHGEFESLTVDFLHHPGVSEAGPGDVYGSYFGLGRRYNISRKFKGSVSALYRVNYRGEVPGLNKIQLRIGIDYSLKKKKRITGRGIH